MANPNCTKCIHFFITMDENRPKACRVFNIKSRVIPSIDVKRFTGHTCPVYEERKKESNVVIKNNQIFDTFA